MGTLVWASTNAIFVNIGLTFGYKDCYKYKVEVPKAKYLLLGNKTVIVLKNGVFWDVTPCGSCNNRRFGGN
jgi:hypothetical protein